MTQIQVVGLLESEAAKTMVEAGEERGWIEPAELEAFLTPLAAAGVSIFHASVRRYWLPAFAGSDRTLAGWTRHLTGLPVITVGSVGVAVAFRGTAEEAVQPSLTLAPLVDLLERGEFDLVAVGRAVLADPEWAAKVSDPWTEFEFAGRGKLKAMAGHEVYGLTPEQLGEWKKAVQPLHASWIEAVKKAGGDPATIDADLQAALKKHNAGL